MGAYNMAFLAALVTSLGLGFLSAVTGDVAVSAACGRIDRYQLK